MSQSNLIKTAGLPGIREVYGHIVLVTLKRDGSAQVLAFGPESRTLLPAARLSFKTLAEAKLTTAPLALSKLTDRAWLAEAVDQHIVQQHYANNPYQLIAVVKPSKRSARLKIGCVEPLR